MSMQEEKVQESHEATATLASAPFIFDEFIDSGFEETVSPFLTPHSRRWGQHLRLRTSSLAGFLLALAFIVSFFPPLTPFFHLLLVWVFFLAGVPSLINAVKDLCNFEMNIDILMTLGAFLSAFIGNSFEGALLLVLFSLSGSLESTVTSKAKGALQSLNQLAPSKAHVLTAPGKLVDKALREIPVSATILVRAGEVIPLDGQVLEGHSSINLVHLTGENLPVTKQPGDEVPAGALNLEGSFSMKVLRTSSESTLSKIIKLISHAQEARPKLQRWLDQASDGYSKLIILLTALLALLLPFIAQIPFTGSDGSIYRSLAFLIAASPCALIIAVPIAYLSAISACARKGILLKGGIMLDALAKCRTLAFDKTGTLTTGHLRCQDLQALGHSPSQEEEAEALAYAYALEQNAVHPIARAIAAHAESRGLQPAGIQGFSSFPGRGLSAKSSDKGKELAIGHPQFIGEKLNDSEREAFFTHLEEANAGDNSLTVLLVEGKLYLFHFLDDIRSGTQHMVEDIHKQLEFKTVVLSGDHFKSVKSTADKVGISDFFADLRPEDKLEKVSQLSSEGGLAMVGDGINDAPALARATVGISMGQVGNNAAVDISDIVLLHDNLEILPWLMRKAQTTQSIIKQNVGLALVAIVFASLSALAGLIPLWLAVILHEGGTVLVGLNSLRLLK